MAKYLKMTPPRSKSLKHDIVGVWSELKLEILKKYATAYSQILTNNRLHHAYIDAFAGAGTHVAKRTRKLIPGSPLNALDIQPPFEDYYLIDLDQARVAELRRLTADRKNVNIYAGDCNAILLTDVFPRIRYEDYRRALCILDPYALHLNWTVTAEAAKLGTVEIFLNFPILDMNRNVLWRKEGASPQNVKRMDAFWGDGSWRDVAYRTDTNLFGEPDKQPNEIIAEAFRERLRNVAGFEHVPEPAPMRNSKGAILYYLFFAAQKPTAERIVRDIFDAYRKRGLLHG